MQTKKALVGAGVAGLLMVGAFAAGGISNSTSSAQTLAASNVAAQVPSANQDAASAQFASNSVLQAQYSAQSNTATTYSDSAPAQQGTTQTSPPAQQPTTATITQAQAEAAALKASPGNTVDHSRLGNESGTPVWDIDFTNGGGVTINAQTGVVIATEAAGADKGRRGHGNGGADQAALAAKATVTKVQAEAAALKASPGNTVDHSRLGGDPNGTIFWDVDFTNGGGVTINAQTGVVIATEAAGTDMGGHRGGDSPPATQP